MRLSLTKKIIFLIITPFCIVHTSQGMDTSNTTNRLALVVGNGSYPNNPLKNPPNDAQDMAEALEKTGFHVRLVLNADLTTFEKAIETFTSELKGKETGLFYYAGHGVQIDGQNYLLPVQPRIEDIHSIRAKAISVDTLVSKMESSGVRTILVILDSCRDNPFPGATRSISRGLAVVPTPKSMNSLIAYAASPGETAEDGQGRNGIFSGALLKYIQIPGLEIGAIMRNVKAEVARITQNKQRPRVDDGMREEFYFISPAVAISKAETEMLKAEQALKEIEARIAQRQKELDAAKNESERERLLLEQQKDRALETVRRLAFLNAQKELETRQKEAAEQEQMKLEQQKIMQKAQSKSQELSQLIALKRSELSSMEAQTLRQSMSHMISTLENYKKTLVEIEKKFDQLWEEIEREITKRYNVQLAELQNVKPFIYETDQEFNARIAVKRASIEKDREQEIKEKRSFFFQNRETETAEIRTRITDLENDLFSRSWVLQGSKLSLKSISYDRNKRRWDFLLSSQDTLLPLSPYKIAVSFTETELPAEEKMEYLAVLVPLSAPSDIKKTIIEFDEAVNADGLSPRIWWGVKYNDTTQQYEIWIHRVEIRNLITESIYADTLNLKISSFQARSMDKTQRFIPVRFVPTTSIKALYAGTTVLPLDSASIHCIAEGQKVKAEFPNGTHTIIEIKPPVDLVVRIKESPLSIVYLNKQDGFGYGIGFSALLPNGEEPVPNFYFHFFMGFNHIVFFQKGKPLAYLKSYADSYFSISAKELSEKKDPTGEPATAGEFNIGIKYAMGILFPIGFFIGPTLNVPILRYRETSQTANPFGVGLSVKVGKSFYLDYSLLFDVKNGFPHHLFLVGIGIL